MTDALFHFNVGPKSEPKFREFLRSINPSRVRTFMLVVTFSYTELHCHGPFFCTALDLTIYSWYRGRNYVI